MLEGRAARVIWCLSRRADGPWVVRRRGIGVMAVPDHVGDPQQQQSSCPCSTNPSHQRAVKCGATTMLSSK